MDMYRKKELDNLVETLYTAQPRIFTGLNDDNKKIMIHLLQLIMDNSNKPELFEVLQQVIDLDEDEIKELAEVLKYTTLNNITKVIKLLQDRLKVIQPHLVHADSNGNNKIYVLTWSDIFDDFSLRHEYLMHKIGLCINNRFWKSYIRFLI